MGMWFLNTINSIHLFLSCTTPISLVYLTAPHILVELEYVPDLLFLEINLNRCWCSAIYGNKFSLTDYAQNSLVNTKHLICLISTISEFFS